MIFYAGSIVHQNLKKYFDALLLDYLISKCLPDQAKQRTLQYQEAMRSNMAQQLLSTNQKDPNTSTHGGHLKSDFKKSFSKDDANSSELNKPKANIQVSDNHNFR